MGLFDELYKNVKNKVAVSTEAIGWQKKQFEVGELRNLSLSSKYSIELSYDTQIKTPNTILFRLVNSRGKVMPLTLDYGDIGYNEFHLSYSDDEEKNVAVLQVRTNIKNINNLTVVGGSSLNNSYTGILIKNINANSAYIFAYHGDIEINDTTFQDVIEVFSKKGIINIKNLQGTSQLLFDSQEKRTSEGYQKEGVNNEINVSGSRLREIKMVGPAKGKLNVVNSDVDNIYIISSKKEYDVCGEVTGDIMLYEVTGQLLKIEERISGNVSVRNSKITDIIFSVCHDAFQKFEIDDVTAENIKISSSSLGELMVNHVNVNKLEVNRYKCMNRETKGKLVISDINEFRNLDGMAEDNQIIIIDRTDDVKLENIKSGKIVFLATNGEIKINNVCVNSIDLEKYRRYGYGLQNYLFEDVNITRLLDEDQQERFTEYHDESYWFLATDENDMSIKIKKLNR